MERENNGVFLAWLLGGLVIGGAVVLLIAPKTGARTRHLLKSKTEKGKRSLLESSQDIVARGRELYERGREIAEETAELFERGRMIAEKTVEERL